MYSGMEPVCRTRQGKVGGRLSAVAGPARGSGRTQPRVASFLGIPYAKASRFGPPGAAARWDGVRPAIGYGPTAPQAPYAPPLDALMPEHVVPGEDCLNLNVWTPSPGPRARLPVMVWIHGGAFANGSGSASAYDGTAFARDGVVVS